MVLRGGTVVDATGSRPGDVVTVGGVITVVGPDVTAPPGATVLDAAGCAVAPGLVHLHTHLRQPGHEEAETVETGARAAARGGFTAVVAMPNTHPPLDSADAVRSVLELARGVVAEVAVAGATCNGLKDRLCDENGKIRRFVNIYLNEEDIRFLQGEATAVKAGDQISIVPAIAGGK